MRIEKRLRPGRIPNWRTLAGSAGAVLFGVGSPITCDFEDLLTAISFSRIFGISNHDSKSWAGDRVILFDITDFPRDLTKYPAFLPFTGPSTRYRVHLEASGHGFSKFPPLIHPSAMVSGSTLRSEGSYVGAGVTVGAGSVLLEHSFVNRGASLAHHNQVSRFATIGPGVVSGGAVIFEPFCFVGLGARILPGITVGTNAVVGAGAVVVEDVPANSVVVGVPARTIRSR